MEVLHTRHALREHLSAISGKQQQIGFVPTMGALHAGHISLIEKAHQTAEIVVTSIFVNPTQFNNKNDLNNYPRDLEKDKALLQAANCDILYAPDVNDIYYEPVDISMLSFGYMDSVMEGKFRPGHFEGVAMVVKRLFEIVQPNYAFFGEKDFQQLAIIRSMVKQLALPLEIIGCPTLREADGLAMSSRNMLLDNAHRQSAPLIAQTLFEARTLKTRGMALNELVKWVTETINADINLEVEYFTIFEAETLVPATQWEELNHPHACIAVWAGGIRLIDNISFYS